MMKTVGCIQSNSAVHINELIYYSMVLLKGELYTGINVTNVHTLYTTQ